jgi:hypothetical protein
MPTSPMAKVGRSATAEVMSRREFFDMRIMCGSDKVIEECMSCKCCQRQFDNEVGMRPEGSKWRKLSHYIDFSERYVTLLCSGSGVPCF